MRLQKTLWVAFVLCLAIFIGSSYPLYALTPPASLKISPLRTYPTQNPGSSSAAKITLTNKSDTDLRISLSVESFKTVNDDYDYAFVAQKEAEWVRFATDSVLLSKQESREVAYSLAVPVDATPGGHYFALVATVDNQNAVTDIREIHRVVSLIYLEVGGAVSRQTHLLSIDLPWLTTARSVDLQASIANSGNTHNRARLGITQQAMPWGKTITIDQSEALTLPSTSRKLQQSIRFANVPAIYQLQASYSPAQGGREVQTKYIVVLPTWLGLAIPLLSYWLYWEWHRYKRHRKTKT